MKRLIALLVLGVFLFGCLGGVPEEAALNSKELEINEDNGQYQITKEEGYTKYYSIMINGNGNTVTLDGDAAFLFYVDIYGENNTIHGEETQVVMHNYGKGNRLIDT